MLNCDRVLNRTRVVSVSQVVPVVWSDVFSVDDVGKRENDVRAQRCVDEFGDKSGTCCALLRCAREVAEQLFRRTAKLLLLLLLLLERLTLTGSN